MRGFCRWHHSVSSGFKSTRLRRWLGWSRNHTLGSVTQGALATWPGTRATERERDSLPSTHAGLALVVPAICPFLQAHLAVCLAMVLRGRLSLSKVTISQVPAASWPAIHTSRQSHVSDTAHLILHIYSSTLPYSQWTNTEQFPSTPALLPEGIMFWTNATGLGCGFISAACLLFISEVH